MVYSSRLKISLWLKSWTLTFANNFSWNSTVSLEILSWLSKGEGWRVKMKYYSFQNLSDVAIFHFFLSLTPTPLRLLRFSFKFIKITSLNFVSFHNDVIQDLKRWNNILDIIPFFAFSRIIPNARLEIIKFWMNNEW